MTTTVALHHHNPKTDKMIEFGPDEQPRSMQLYGVDPDITAKATRASSSQPSAASLLANLISYPPALHGGAARSFRPVGIGHPVGSELRRAMASSLSKLDDLLGTLDHDAPFPADILGQSRGRTNAPAKVVLSPRLARRS